MGATMAPKMSETQYTPEQDAIADLLLMSYVVLALEALFVNAGGHATSFTAYLRHGGWTLPMMILIPSLLFCGLLWATALTYRWVLWGSRSANRCQQ